METDDGEGRSTWRMYHDNVAVSKGDRGRLTWKLEYDKDYENLDKKSSAGVENDRKLWTDSFSRA